MIPIPVPAIPPELVARKLAAAASLQSPKLAARLKTEPRLVDLLWFIQWHSFQPGGLAKLADDLLAAFPDRVSIPVMRKAGPPGKAGKWTLVQCLTAWRAEYQPGGLGCDDYYAPAGCDLSEFYRWARSLHAGDTDFNGLTPAQSAEGVRRFNFDYFATAARDLAARSLPEVLKAFCEAGNLDSQPALLEPPTWFPALVESLLEFMGQHAARERARLAMTEVTLKVFDALDFAVAERKLVRITGSARFGKTESVRTYCAMYPGRLRLVTVPCSNSERDLVRAVAEALGLAASYSADATSLRGKVEFILRHGRIGFVIAEGHFLFPTRYNSGTTPARLNWLRTQIVDRHLPCALVSTPQAYDGQRKRFDKATGYNMEQFTGRLALSIELPDRLSVADMTAVARLHFPDLRESLVGMAVGAAKQSQSYLKSIEGISSRARWLAGKRGAAGVALRDMEAAISDVVPEVASQATGDGQADAEDGLYERPAEVMPPRRKTAADVVREVCEDRFSGPELAGRERAKSARQASELVSA